MSEHPGLKFAPQTTRSPILPSMPPLVLFIISMASHTFSTEIFHQNILNYAATISYNISFYPRIVYLDI